MKMEMDIVDGDVDIVIVVVMETSSERF